MGKTSFLQPFQMKTHKFFYSKTHISSERFNGIAHFIREKTGLSLFSGADGTSCAASGGKADASGVFFLFLKKLKRKPFFFFYQNFVQNMVYLLTGVSSVQGFL